MKNEKTSHKHCKNAVRKRTNGQIMQWWPDDMKTNCATLPFANKTNNTTHYEKLMITKYSQYAL